MEIALEQVAEKIRKASRIIITAHVHPDGDCLGSMLALNEYLLSSGKNVSMLLDDEIPAMYSFLYGCRDIHKPVPTAVISADLLIVIDASDLERIGNVKTWINAPLLNIDHHISNTKFADYRYVDSTAAATGEIIFQLLRLMQADITTTMAVSLFTAIATDCGFFRYANTSAQTLRFAAELVELGAKPYLISEYIETKSFADMLTLIKVLQTLELHYNSRIACITIEKNMVDELSDNTEGFINYPRNIEGVEIALMFRIVDQTTVRVSFRSRNVDVSTLALAFGGGGHARAAGCTLNQPLDTAKMQILNASAKLVKKYYDSRNY